MLPRQNLKGRYFKLKRQYGLLFVVISLLIPVLTSCHSSRQPARASSAGQTVSRSAGEPSVSSRLLEGQKEWNDVQLPVSVSLRQPLSASLNATAYMRRGEYVKFSVRMLGFEVASVWIDTESVHAVDKVGKRYVSESVSRLTTELGLDIADVQDILLGRVFSVSGVELAASSFEVQPTEYEDMLLLRPYPRQEILDYGFVVSGSEAPMLSYLLVDSGSFNAVARYSGQDVTPAGPVAREVSATFSAPGKDVAADITWNLGSAKWNKGNVQKWQTPGRGYSKISLNTLLSILKKL